MGAETLARYRFQAEVAARPAFAMLDGSVVAVVCEWHEDHVIVHRDGSCELVSVKHRELSQGPWTLPLLVTDGGLAHLYQRWVDTGRRCTCHLATNGGLKAGDAADLATACSGKDEARLLAFARSLAPRLSASSEADAGEFLRVLSIESGLPGRNDIAASNLHQYVRPALRSSGFSESMADQAYEHVVQTIEVASRDRAGASHVLLAFIADPNRFREDVQRGRKLDSRTITPDHVRLAIARAASPGRPLLSRRSTGRSSNLVRKLESGGLGPTLVESAQRLRASWTEFEALYSTDLPGGDDVVEDIRSRVQAVAGEAEAQALVGGTRGDSYGLAMYLELKVRLHGDALGLPKTLPLDDLLLEGLAFQLTDECPVWWSPRFDLTAK